MCAGSRAIAVKLAQHPSIFDGVLGACHACHARADDAPEQRAKGRLLLQASCALATESADGLADGRIVRFVGDDLASWVTIARTGAGAATCGDGGERWGGPADAFGREAACGRPLGLRPANLSLAPPEPATAGPPEPEPE